MVRPVEILSAMFCGICSLLVLVSDASGDHPYGGNVLKYGSYYGFVCCEDRFLCFPHVVHVSALSICIIFRAFVVVIYMSLLYVSLGSRVSPSIFGLMFIGRVVLFICSSSCVLYSAGSGVKKVHVVLSGLRMRLFV